MYFYLRGLLSHSTRTTQKKMELNFIIPILLFVGFHVVVLHSFAAAVRHLQYINLRHSYPNT